MSKKEELSNEEALTLITLALLEEVEKIKQKQFIMMIITGIMGVLLLWK